jgi:hypothetical protein
MWGTFCHGLWKMVVNNLPWDESQRGEAVSGHPVIGEGERACEIGRSRTCHRVDAGLERIAPAHRHGAVRLVIRPFGTLLPLWVISSL